MAASAEAPPAAIVDGSAVLRQSPAEIEASLGQPVRSRAERSTTVMIELPDRAIAPRTYEAALEAVNLPSGPPPDRVTRDSREWHNLETIILSVHRLP